MGYNIAGWLTEKMKKKGIAPENVHGSYMGRKQYKQKLEDADIPEYRRRGDSDDDYDPYSDREMDEEPED